MPLFFDGCLPGPGAGYSNYEMPGVSPSQGRPRLRALPGSGQAQDAEYTDEQIIEGVQQGDSRVSAALYDRLYPTVDHTLYRIFGRREPDHDDLVQAAFEQIVLTLSKQSFARACSLKTWASTVASHVGLNALRSRRRERKVYDRVAEVEAQCPVSSSDPERESDSRALLERVRTELGNMSLERAEAVFLHDVLGHELAEIALMTGVSVAAAQSRLVRGRRELVRRLGRSEPLGGES